MPDQNILDYYEYGIRKLVEIAFNCDEYYDSVLIYEQRLLENIFQTRQFGDTENRRAERAEIIAYLNRITLALLRTSFLGLCRSESNSSAISSRVEIKADNNYYNLRPGAWTPIPSLATTYTNYIESIYSLEKSQEYEGVKSSYWKILYFLNYRELWGESQSLSRFVLALSKKNNDLVNSGLILSKGIAYSFAEQNQYLSAEYNLKLAYEYFKVAKFKEGEAICWNIMADIYLSIGKYQVALNCYDEAKKGFVGIEEYQLNLKRLFLITSSDDLKINSRIIALSMLRDKFSEIKDYREALVDLEIAKSYDAKGDNDQALLFARNSFTLLNDVISMPRNAIKARNFLKYLNRKQKD
jgi:hypothetical protein